MLKRGFNGFHSTSTSLPSFKSFIFYSTSVASKHGVATPFMVEYLIKSIGFTEKEAVAILTKVRHPFKSTIKSELVIDFLKRSGFDGTQIRKVVASFPDVLKNNVDKTLSPKIRVFQDLGFYGSDLGLIISQHPFVLARNVESDIVPAFAVLKSIFGSDEPLIRFMLQIKSNRLLCFHSLKNLPANMLLLKSYGVTSEGIKLLMLSRGFPFARTQWVEKILKGVEEKLGIPRTSGMFIHGISALTKKNEEKIESWLEVFRSYGWSETEISRLLRRHPLCLSLSEKSLRLKLKYFMEDLGYGSDYLATDPIVLSYSMEKRIVPRAAVIQTLKDRRLLKQPVTVFRSLRMTESQFAKKFVLPYKDELPELYEIYAQAMGYYNNNNRPSIVPPTAGSGGSRCTHPYPETVRDDISR